MMPAFFCRLMLWKPVKYIAVDFESVFCGFLRIYDTVDYCFESDCSLLVSTPYYAYVTRRLRLSVSRRCIFFCTKALLRKNIGIFP